MSSLAVLDVAKGIATGMTDAAIVFDRELKPVYFNASFLAMSGLRRRALETELEERRDPLRLTDQEGGFRAYREQCLKLGQPVRLAEVAVANGAGQIFTVLYTMLPISDEAGVGAIIEYFRDVSDEARIQARYKEMLALEQARAADLEKQVEQRTQELTAALEEVTRLSRADPLTKVLNRRAFAEHAEQALTVAKRHDRSLAIIMCDLDHFKRLNDTYGHQAGDAVLTATARCLEQSVRASDKVARFGGEEFVVLLVETAPEAAVVVAERCRSAIRDLDLAQLASHATGQQTASLGVAVFPEHGDTLDGLIARADQALYHAKHTGRDRTVVFAPELKATASTSGGQRSPVLVGPSLDQARLSESLGEHYEVVRLGSVKEAIAECTRLRPDVIIAEETDDDSGIELLSGSLRACPEALRVLVIHQADLFLESRGTNLARVDCFILDSDLKEHLASALKDARVQRDTHRQRLLAGGDSIRRAFSSRVDELEQLLDARAMAFHFQPIVEPKSRVVFAYEALCRIAHPVFQNPTVLFDAAIQSGNIWRLGRLIREVVLGQVPSLPDDTMLFVNVHPAEVEDPTFIEVGKALEIRAPRVVFEITERGAISDLRRFRTEIERLKAFGYRIAIDDLGAGYASLNSVALLNPDFIKIDMAMVREIDASPQRASLVRRLVDYANDQGIRVIAEGVETEAEARTIAELGCHLAQGYYFGRPGPQPL
jgi:diguanylate cyclase (GGDEF)-like protein